jgi:hypothetical protein
MGPGSHFHLSGPGPINFTIVPIVAEVLARAIYSGGTGLVFALAIVLCLIIGAPIYYAISNVEKA